MGPHIEVPYVVYKAAPWIELIGGIIVACSVENTSVFTIGLIAIYTGTRALMLRTFQK